MDAAISSNTKLEKNVKILGISPLESLMNIHQFRMALKEKKSAGFREFFGPLIHVAFVNFQQVGGAKIQAVTGRPTICRVKSLDP